MAEKKSSAKKVSKVMDYFDMISHMVANYMGRRYNISQKIEDVKNTMLDALYSFKKEFFKSTIEIFLLMTGLAALVVGIILFLMKYVSLDKILIAYGLIVSFAVLLTSKLRR
jgi:hypothetical protein